MSSSRLDFFRTLRFRIAATYIGVFVLLTVLGFAALYGRHAVKQIQFADANLDFQFAEFAVEYLTGEEYEGPRAAVPLSAVPAGLVPSILRRHPGLRLLYAFSESPSRYWVAGVLGSSAYVFDLRAPAWEAQARAIAPDDRDGHMAHQFNADEYHEAGLRHYANMLLSPDGSQVLAASPVSAARRAAFLEAAKGLRAGGRRGVEVEGDHWRVGRDETFDGKVFVFAYLYDSGSLHRIVLTGLSCLVLTVVVGSCVSWYVSGRLVRGIDAIRDSAGRVKAGDYSVRVPPLGGGIEIDSLADSFNAMVAGTETMIADLRTISDNIAHDLKTPITRMRGKAEMAFQDGSAPDLAADVAEECAGMLRMINTMLEITRTVSGSKRARHEKVDVREIAKESRDLFSTVADDKGIRLSLALPEQSVKVAAERVHVQRLLANLIDNAIKFTPQGGRVSMAIRSDGRSALVVVADTGCGIAEADRAHVFDRFYRSDRSRNIPGNGLGLSLVQAIVALYGGCVAIASEPGRGTAVTVSLPLAP